MPIEGVLEDEAAAPLADKGPTGVVDCLAPGVAEQHHKAFGEVPLGFELQAVVVGAAVVVLIVNETGIRPPPPRGNRAWAGPRLVGSLQVGQ
ncbi:MAG: hypothetical protein DMG08_30575, partial [Acidobacteria bacterium]